MIMSSVGNRVVKYHVQKMMPKNLIVLYIVGQIIIEKCKMKHFGLRNTVNVLYLACMIFGRI